MDVVFFIFFIVTITFKQEPILSLAIIKALNMWVVRSINMVNEVHLENHSHGFHINKLY